MIVLRLTQHTFFLLFACFLGRLTTMSDVYSFGVVLLELLTGKKSVDKKRATREQHLVEWGRPLLKDSHKLERIMDTRLEDQYSTKGAKQLATLTYQCLSHNDKSRPTMRSVVKTLESIMELNDIPIGHFVYVVPNEITNEDSLNVNKKEQENECDEFNKIEVKIKEKGQNRNRKSRGNKRKLKRLRSRAVYSDTALYYSPTARNRTLLA